MEITKTDTGHGRPYLLLHGGAGPMSFTGLGIMLAGHGRVVTPTHPGFGGTERPPEMDSVGALATRYVELIEELDLADVCVVGNSLGGWVAAEIAAHGSSRVSAIVLVDAVGIEVPEHPIPDLDSLSPAELIEQAWFDPSKAVDPTTLPPAIQATLPGNRVALAVYGGTMQDPTLLGRLGTVTTPTLVVWGEADRIGDVDYGRAYAAAIPGARFELLPRAGHLPQLETPEALHALVRDFAGEHAAGTPA
jgi:pimeloyl-ACP methyl ester carboxylesterase